MASQTTAVPYLLLSMITKASFDSVILSFLEIAKRDLVKTRRVSYEKIIYKAFDFAFMHLLVLFKT